MSRIYIENVIKFITGTQTADPVHAGLGSCQRRGTLARGTGDVVSSTKIDGFAGAYDVEFDDNVRGCLYVATIGNSTDLGTEPSGEITTNGRFNSVNGVFIQTGDSSGAVADRGFHLLVTCYGF